MKQYILDASHDTLLAMKNKAERDIEELTMLIEKVSNEISREQTILEISENVDEKKRIETNIKKRKKDNTRYVEILEDITNELRDIEYCIATINVPKLRITA